MPIVLVTLTLRRGPNTRPSAEPPDVPGLAFWPGKRTLKENSQPLPPGVLRLSQAPCLPITSPLAPCFNCVTWGASRRGSA